MLMTLLKDDQMGTLCSGICCAPHLTGKYGTRPFYGGSGRRAVAHTRPAFPKNAYGPVGIVFVLRLFKKEEN